MSSGGVPKDDDVLVLPPLPADPLFVDAVDDAVSGDVELPEAQPSRVIGADPHDFASLYIRHRSSFGLHARRFLHDPRDVDEVLQEAFLRLFLAMPELDTELQALAYCRRTVTNLCIDRYRADQRRPRLVDLEAVDVDGEISDWDDDPVLRAEDAAIVREALSLLTPLHRAALVKREIEEKSLPQIAKELEIPEESVKHLLHRARRALRRLLVGTTAEPGVDLSNTQMLRLANERLARATLRGANVLIVLFVAAVTVAGGLRATTTGDENVGSGVLTPAVSPGVTGAVGNPAGPAVETPQRTDSPARPAAESGPPAPAPSPASSAPAATPPRHEPESHDEARLPVVTPPVADPVSAPVAPAYSITAPVRITGAVQVSALERTIDATGGVQATTKLVAPTEVGTFALTQTLVQDSVGSSMEMTLRPTFTTAKGTSVGSLNTARTSIARAADGQLTIDVSAAASIGDAPFDVDSLQAHIVLAGDLTTVLAESVVVGAESSPATALPGAATPGPGGDTAPADLATAGRPVIGMSPIGSGDRQGAPSSTSVGGSVPLLPSPSTKP